jgi:DNA-binding NarL/FixJ family response regulator
MSLDNLISFLLIAVIIGAIVVVAIHFLRKQGVSGNKPEGRKIRVLVVDSDANARETLVKFLRFEKTLEIVGVASSGRAAIKQAKQLNPTVVVLDVSLEDMEGIAVAKAISQEMPNMQFVFTRGASEPEPPSWVPGMPKPLPKPLDYHELIKTIQQASHYR